MRQLVGSFVVVVLLPRPKILGTAGRYVVFVWLQFVFIFIWKFYYDHKDRVMQVANCFCFSTVLVLLFGIYLCTMRFHLYAL